MRSALPTPGLIAHRKALEAASIAISLVLRVPAPLKSLADQVIRSASSVPANLAEGHGRSGRDRMHHWRIAFASAKEVDTHLRLLLGAGSVDPNQAESSTSTLRRGSSPHLAPPPPESVMKKESGKHCSAGRAGFDNVPHETSGSASPPAHCHTGHSTGRALITGCPGSDGGRRRMSSVVAVIPIHPRVKTLLVRRWVAEGGPEGR